TASLRGSWPRPCPVPRPFPSQPGRFGSSWARWGKRPSWPASGWRPRSSKHSATPFGIPSFRMRCSRHWSADDNGPDALPEDDPRGAGSVYSPRIVTEERPTHGGSRLKTIDNLDARSLTLIAVVLVGLVGSQLCVKAGLARSGAVA